MKTRDSIKRLYGFDGGDGNDMIDGGDCDDFLKGGKGNDNILGGDDEDLLDGGKAMMN